LYCGWYFEAPTQALIDNSANTVLISPDFVTHLGLVPHQLLKEKEVVLALGTGKKDTFSFEEWVPVTVISSDQAWTSNACHAIVAPHLCDPLLLGGPFLSSN
jgi:hypothetical protein